MSPTTSDTSAAMRIMRSANSIYTVLLICVLVVLVALVIYMVDVNNTRFGYTMPFGDEYQKSQDAATAVDRSADRHAGAVKDAMTKFNLDTRLSGGAGNAGG